MDDRTRGVVAHGVVALAAVGALYVLVLEPRLRSLEKIDAALAQAELAARQSQRLQEQMPRLLHHLDALQRRADRLRNRGRTLDDESALYVALNDLAAAHSIRINRMEPFTPDVKDAFPADDPDQTPTVPRDRLRTAGYNLALAGEYPNVQAFLNALQKRFGFTRIRSLHLQAPGESASPDLPFELTIECFAFDPSPVARADQPEGDDA